MIHDYNEDLGQENHKYSSATASDHSKVQNPRHLDDDTFHENPEEDETATTYGTERERNYNDYTDDRDIYSTEETDDGFNHDAFEEEAIDEDDLNDDFNDNRFDRDDFDTE